MLKSYRKVKQFRQHYRVGNVLYVRDLRYRTHRRSNSMEKAVQRFMIAVILASLFGFYIFAVVAALGQDKRTTERPSNSSGVLIK